MRIILVKVPDQLGYITVFHKLRKMPLSDFLRRDFNTHQLCIRHSMNKTEQAELLNSINMAVIHRVHVISYY